MRLKKLRDYGADDVSRLLVLSGLLMLLLGKTNDSGSLLLSSISLFMTAMLITLAQLSRTRQ